MSSWLQKTGGLRFKCTSCGECCKAGKNNPVDPVSKMPLGNVLVNGEECRRLAARLKLSVDEFIRLFTWNYDPEREMRTLKMTREGCILWDPVTKLCTVHGDHPLQCRTYPFWFGTTKTEEAWVETCKKCEGAGTADGNFYPADRVRMLAVGTMRLKEQGIG